MKTKYTLIAAVASLFVCSGCVDFRDCVAMQGDNLVDNDNMSYVAQDRKIYEQRMRFKRQVAIKMSEKGYRFLAPATPYRRRGAGKLFLSPALRKDLMATADSTLVNIVSSLRDFEVVSSEASLRSTPGAVITRIPADNTSPTGPYLFTFNINNVEMCDANDTIRGVTTIADIAMDVGGASRNSRRLVRRGNEVHWYYAVVSLEVSLTAPDGKNIFNFAQKVTYDEKLPSSSPSESTLKQAVAFAVRAAMRQYAVKFGPPIYVDQTIGNGLFARLSAGSEYGIQPNQKVRFFRQVSRKVPTLPNEPEKFEISKQFIREGIVGIYGAPVERDHAWVYLSGNDDPLKRSVFTWTSAEIIK